MTDLPPTRHHSKPSQGATPPYTELLRLSLPSKQAAHPARSMVHSGPPITLITSLSIGVGHYRYPNSARPILRHNTPIFFSAPALSSLIVSRQLKRIHAGRSANQERRVQENFKRRSDGQEEREILDREVIKEMAKTKRELKEWREGRVGAEVWGGRGHVNIPLDSSSSRSTPNALSSENIEHQVDVQPVQGRPLLHKHSPSRRTSSDVDEAMRCSQKLTMSGAEECQRKRSLSGDGGHEHSGESESIKMKAIQKRRRVVGSSAGSVEEPPALFMAQPLFHPPKSIDSMLRKVEVLPKSRVKTKKYSSITNPHTSLHETPSKIELPVMAREAAKVAEAKLTEGIRGTLGWEASWSDPKIGR